MCFFSVNGELTIAKFDYRVVFQRLVWMGIHLVDPYQKKSAGGKHVRKFRLNLDQLIMRCNQQEKTHSLLQRDPAHARIKKHTRFVIASLSNTREQDRDRIIDWLLGHASTTKGKFLHASHKSPRRHDFKDFKAASRLLVHQDILEAGRKIAEKELAPLTGPTRQFYRTPAVVVEVCSLSRYHKLLQSILLNSFRMVSKDQWPPTD